MEQLTAIVFDDFKRKICAGYKDITEQEFWVRGHMPGMPLMPGVLMCEAAAQMCSYYAHKHNLLGECKVVGFGGMEDVRFRDPVRRGRSAGRGLQDAQGSGRPLIVLPLPGVRRPVDGGRRQDQGHRRCRSDDSLVAAARMRFSAAEGQSAARHDPAVTTTIPRSARPTSHSF